MSSTTQADPSSLRAAPAAAGPLLVVSNRLPWSLRRTPEGWRSEPSAGGLATAMLPILERSGGGWIGWPGEAPREADPEREAEIARWAEQGYTAVDLPRAVARRFYEGYSNQTLWPLFHNFPMNLEYEQADWDAYVEANERFRDAVLPRLSPGTLVWVHDYHLMLLPKLLREAAPDVGVGFFLHIPFPASENLRLLPRREELLRGLLGADFLAFQTFADLQHFRASLLRVLGLESRMDRVQSHGALTRLAALPIGIAPEEFSGPLLKDEAVRGALAAHRARFADCKVMVAVDRLDYTKGIPQRLRSFRRLLRQAPELRGRVVLVQVAVPSRERIPMYDELRHRVSELVGEINGEFSTPEWTPVVFIRRGISRAELIALYAAAEVGWVTPLRDGMNLVAKEYVACHPEGDGVLVLSEFAGAAAEMGEAFLVNPYDEDRTAAVLERVLELPAEERRDRMGALHRRVWRNDVFAWGDRFLRGLRAAVGERGEWGGERLPPLTADQAVAAFREAPRRLLLLDYDGTLVPFAKRPREAVPSPDLVGLLARLGAAAGTTVAVVSERPQADLQRWFGALPGVWLGAEHGTLLRAPGAAEWERLHQPLALDWKARVHPVLDHYVDRTPGSFVEEKEYALVWHHRMADPEFGEWLANELVATLEELLAETELRAVRGHKVVEVRYAWATKSEVLARLEAQGGGYDFRLAVGDDRTDEDLFESLPAEAWTIHVGPGPSRARFSLADPAAVRRFLQRLG